MEIYKMILDTIVCIAIVGTLIATGILAYFAYKASKYFIKPTKVQYELNKLNRLEKQIDNLHAYSKKGVEFIDNILTSLNDNYRDACDRDPNVNPHDEDPHKDIPFIVDYSEDQKNRTKEIIDNLDIQINLINRRLPKNENSKYLLSKLNVILERFKYFDEVLQKKIPFPICMYFNEMLLNIPEDKLEDLMSAYDQYAQARFEELMKS